MATGDQAPTKDADGSEQTLTLLVLQKQTMPPCTLYPTRPQHRRAAPSSLISPHNPSKNNRAYLYLWFGFPQPVTSDKCDVHKKRTTSQRGKKQLKTSPWVRPQLPLWGGRGSMWLRFHGAESGAGGGGWGWRPALSPASSHLSLSTCPCSMEMMLSTSQGCS